MYNRYYQENKKRLQKEVRERYLSKEEKTKSFNMLVNDI